MWLACQTQWRISYAGATGLDYTALFPVAAALAIPVDAAMLHKIQTLETQTLDHWRREQAKEKPKR